MKEWQSLLQYAQMKAAEASSSPLESRKGFLFCISCLQSYQSEAVSSNVPRLSFQENLTSPYSCTHN